MQAVELHPRSLNRSMAPERLPTTVARTMQWVDAVWRPGSIFRAFGAARTQVQSSANTTLTSFTATTQDGSMIALDCDNQTVRFTPGDGTTPKSGPLNQWADTRTAET